MYISFMTALTSRIEIDIANNAELRAGTPLLHFHACSAGKEVMATSEMASPRLDFDSLISGIDTVSIPESLGIDSYRYRIDSS
jgi:hypothetical protein